MRVLLSAIRGIRYSEARPYAGLGRFVPSMAHSQ